jgi:hypothetical protein
MKAVTSQVFLVLCMGRGGVGYRCRLMSIFRAFMLDGRKFVEVLVMPVDLK